MRRQYNKKTQSRSENKTQKHCPYHICANTEHKSIEYGVLTFIGEIAVDLCKAYGLLNVDSYNHRQQIVPSGNQT